jgi:hypothetical protein
MLSGLAKDYLHCLAKLAEQKEFDFSLTFLPLVPFSLIFLKDKSDINQVLKIIYFCLWNERHSYHNDVGPSKYCGIQLLNSYLNIKIVLL